MRRASKVNGVVAALLFVALQVNADEVINLGGDVYSSGADLTMSVDVPRDVFLTGFSVNLKASVAEDAHAAAFNVEIDETVAGDLYAMGSNVEIDAPVGRDLTATGFNVELDDGARVSGNTRLLGASISIDGPLEGSLLASGGTIKLDSAVKGDVRLAASRISFGKNASIAGTLSYSAPKPVDIPETVIPAGRVKYQPLSRSEMFDEIRDTVDDSIPGFWPSLAAGLISLLVLLTFLLIVTAVCLAFMPKKVELLRRTAREHGWRSLVYGFLGLSALVGAIVVSAMTVVGIPLVPLVLLALVLFWTLGYLLGVYVVAMRVWESMNVNGDSVFTKLLITASGLLAMTVVNLVPLLGWIINLGVVLFGLGAFTYLLIERIVRSHEAVISE